jgi:hypothetical protein
VVAVRRKQLALALRDLLGVETFYPAHDQLGADVVGFGSGGERGEEVDLGYFCVGDQGLFVFVQIAFGWWIVIQADSSIPEIALTTVRFIRTVTENRAPPRRAAATTSWV